MHSSWAPLLQSEFQKDYFKKLSYFLDTAYAQKTIFPPRAQIFSVFNNDLHHVKVVILGQDPYHKLGQAHGLAFSVNSGLSIPPSLQNIFKERLFDLKLPIPKNGNLSRWAEQGVFLLNNVLTVESGHAGSHRRQGWEIFSEEIIKHLNTQCDHLVFILWGRDARSKKEFINEQKHLVLEAAHPSPLSAHKGFFGTKPFSKCNQQLEKWGYQTINW